MLTVKPLSVTETFIRGLMSVINQGLLEHLTSCFLSNITLRWVLYYIKYLLIYILFLCFRIKGSVNNVSINDKHQLDKEVEDVLNPLMQFMDEVYVLFEAEILV